MRKSIKLLLFGFTIFLWSCDNPIEDVNIVLDTDDIINTTIAVELTNAIDGSPISDFADISITGPDASMVLDLIGEREYSTAGDGLLTLILHPDALPSPSNPINFTINANVDGYETIARNVTLTDIGNSVEVIDMINLQEPPEGLLFLESFVETGQNGQLLQDFTISNTLSNGRVSLLGFGFNINFPAGTTFLDQDGNPLFGTVQFRTRISNSSHPLGGFIRTTEGDPFSIYADAQFSLEVSVNGTKAFTSSKDFDFNIDFNEVFEESDLKILIQPINENPEEKNTSDTEFNGSNIFSKFKRFGLIDFSIRNRLFRSPFSSIKDLVVNVNSNMVPEFGQEDNYGDKYSYSVTFIDPVTSEEKVFIKERKFSFIDGSTLEFKGFPGIEDYKITVKSDFGDDIGSASISVDRSNNISLTFPNEAIKFKLIGTCDGGDFQVGATATIYYKPTASDAFPKLLGTIQSGEMISHKLTQGVEYEFSTRFNGNIVSAKGTVTSTEYSEIRELPANICDNF